MADTDDNRISVAGRGQVAETNPDNFDLSDVPEEFAELVEDSSLISPVASTNRASGNDPSERIPLPEFMDPNDIRTGWSLTNLPESITVPSVGAVTFAGDVSNITNSMESLRNSTSSFLQSSNETIIQSTSSWTPEEIGVVAIVTFMVPFILLSNVFVIISVVRFRRLHTPTNYFITSLAAVDIIVALATPFGIMLEVLDFGGVMDPEDSVVCLIPNRVLMMACGVSVLTLATIAYDRHTALVSPLEYINIMTARKVAIMVSITWLYSAFIVWLPLMAGWYDLISPSTPCSSNLIQGKAPVLFLSAIFVPSCIAILVCYFRIFMVARHHAKAIAAVEFAVHRHLQVKFIIKDTKYAKTLAMVIGVFLILWLPYLTFVFIRAVSSLTFNKWIQTYLLLLTVFNSGINPWLYAFKNNELRAAFKRLFREICRSKLCRSMDRRTSLISAISGTPRLSRTDSRMASLVPELTVYTINEKLRQSLAFLDEQIIDNKHSLYDNNQRRQTVSALGPSPSSFLCPKSSLRAAASCSDLDIIKTGSSHNGKCRRFSVDVTAPHNETAPHNDTDSYGVTSLYLELFPQDGDTHINESSDYSCNDIITHALPSSSNTPVRLTPLTSSMSLPCTPIYLQPPPSIPCSRRSSTSSHSFISSFVHPSPENKQNIQTQEPQQHTQLLPQQQQQNTQLLPQQQQHTQLLPQQQQQNTQLLPQQQQHTQLLPQQQQDTHLLPQQQQDTHLLPHQHLKHSQSLAYVQEAVLPGTSWTNIYCHDTLTDAIFHPYVQLPNSPVQSSSDPTTTHPKDAHTLTHTHSCPIFDPITTYNHYYPQIIEHRTSQSHHGKSNLHSNRLDFVSLVNREVESSCNGRYLV